MTSPPCDCGQDTCVECCARLGALTDPQEFGLPGETDLGGESIAACPACGPGTAAIQAHADHRDAIAALFLETGRLLGAFQIRWERGENLSLDAVAALVQVRTLLRRAAEGVR